MVVFVVVAHACSVVFRDGRQWLCQAIVEIDRDLSLKHVGALSLARLYGEFRMVQFRYCMSSDF
jgi:hypothetical protein